jgi:hypothetical protein
MLFVHTCLFSNHLLKAGTDVDVINENVFPPVESSQTFLNQVVQISRIFIQILMEYLN